MSEYPNRGQYIHVHEAQDLATDLHNPNQWCALHIQQSAQDNQGTYQSYLTPEWGNVRGVLSSDVSHRITQEIGDVFYPSPEVYQQEIEDVLRLCETLTETEKMIAEFWAGGPGTCTPPGFWILFAIYSSRCHKLSIVRQVDLYYRMGASLFEASIGAWRLKRKYLQERPIQSIRKLRPIRSNVLFPDGTTGTSQLWRPYQHPTFVTPPFPDFVSGHSTFSSIGSRVLTEFFGTNVIPTNYMFDAAEIEMLSPLLKKTDPRCNLCQVHIYPHASKIASGAIPSTGITLGWTSWDQMAGQAGKSRLYGGIHYESSNQGGLALGRHLYHYLFDEK